MVNRLTSEEVKSGIVKLFPSAITEKSALSQVGATNISYGTESVRKIRLGAPSAVKEGEPKPASDLTIKESETVRVKLVYAFAMSKESSFYESENYKADVLAQAVNGIVKASDITVLNGTDPRTGDKLDHLSAVNLKDNAKQAVATGDIFRDLLEVSKATKKSSGMIVSNQGYGELAYAINDKNGELRFPGIRKSSAFTLPGGNEAVYSSGFGLDGWTSTEDFENSNLLVTGDWSQLGRSFSGITVESSTEGEVEPGRNLFRHNEIGYIVEMFMSFVIPDPAGFTILKSADSE